MARGVIERLKFSKNAKKFLSLQKKDEKTPRDVDEDHFEAIVNRNKKQTESNFQSICDDSFDNKYMKDSFIKGKVVNDKSRISPLNTKRRSSIVKVPLENFINNVAERMSHVNISEPENDLRKERSNTLQHVEKKDISTLGEGKIRRHSLIEVVRNIANVRNVDEDIEFKKNDEDQKYDETNIDTLQCSNYFQSSNTLKRENASFKHNLPDIWKNDLNFEVKDGWINIAEKPKRKSTASFTQQTINKHIRRRFSVDAAVGITRNCAAA